MYLWKNKLKSVHIRENIFALILLTYIYTYTNYKESLRILNFRLRFSFNKTHFQVLNILTCRI